MREKILQYLLDNNIREFKEVARIIQSYQIEPEKVVRSLGIQE
ncbi:hypothetical protein [Geoglobus sp.]